MPLELPAVPPLFWALPALIVAGALLRRVPVIGRIITALTWVAMIGALLFVLGERERFDPYLSRIAGVLALDDQTVGGEDVRIRMAGDGHFWARATIGGVQRRMLIDSGATVTALSPETAAAAGLEVRDPVVPLILRTANGPIRAQTAQVPELRLGTIAARNLDVVVSGGMGDTDVIGMNLLSRLKSWRVEGRTLILVPHHPQRAKS